MSSLDRPDAADLAGPGLVRRLAAARRILLAAAVAASVAVVAGGLSPLLALAGFALVAAAALLPNHPPRRSKLAGDVPAVAPPPAAPVVDDRLARLVAALPEPTLLVDRRSLVVAANARIEAAVGAPQLGEPLSFTLRVPEVLEAARAVGAGGAARRVEFQARIPVDRWYEANVAPVRFSAAGVPPEQPDVVLVMLRDLTQQRRLEQMRADFVANASHELRTPLASLSGFIETLQGPARNDAAARERFLAIMVEQARRMSRLIDDLLSLSRIELNLHIRPDKRVDLGHVVREVIDALAPLAEERGVELRLKEEAQDLMVQGDRDELIRVFENLVENALKYGLSDKGIDVVCAAASREDGSREAVVSVIDYGPGIAPEHLPRLTERFYRIDVPRSREQGGTGLGLAIVKHIVNRHRGRLAITSDVGSGTTFAIRLDLASIPVTGLKPESYQWPGLSHWLHERVIQACSWTCSTVRARRALPAARRRSPWPARNARRILVKLTTLASALALVAAGALVSGTAEARDRIQVVGSSTVFPFTTAVAERFGQKSGKAPIVESTGTGGGMKLFCAGVGANTPDAANASRRITKSEFDTCKQNGVTPIEVKIGFDGIVVANSKKAPEMDVTLEQIYLALAAEIPGPDGQLIKNPNQTWSDVAPNLPNKKIEVLGPPPTSGTRDAFNEMALDAGCKSLQKRLGVKIEAKQCMQVRADGAYIEAGENDNIIVQKLDSNPNAFGVFGYSFLEENQDKIQGSKINGVEDSVDNIASAKYPLSRSLYVYVKKEHIGVIPGLQDFVAEYVSEAAFGEDGYLEKKGLVPLPKADREESAKVARAGTGLAGL